MAAVAGAAAGLFWLPLGLAPALPLAMLVALRGLRRVESSREAVRFGLVFGAARYAVASHFLLALFVHSPLAIVFYLLAIAFILPFAVLESWGALQLERRLGVPRSVGFALLFALLEKVRTLGDLSFPADLLSHAFGTAPAWLSWNRWFGPFGLTLLVFATAALLDEAIERRRRPRPAFAIALIAIALWAAPPFTDLMARAVPPVESPPTLRVGFVQPATPVAWKLDRARWPAMWRGLEDLTLDLAPGVDLVVWPETARPGPLVWKDAKLADPDMQALSDRAAVPILYGCDIARRDRGATRIYNGAALVRPGGGVVEWYGKQRLLPFAEGIPFAQWIGWDPSQRDRSRRNVLTLLGNFSRGPGPHVFEVGAARIGVLICYEGMYPNLARAYRARGANSLCVLSNDTWWGRSLFPAWHARMVASRARELDLPVIRAANSGVSSMTDARGVLARATRLFESTTLEVPLEPSRSAPTFYARHGDWVIGLGMLVAGLFWTRARLRRDATLQSVPVTAGAHRKVARTARRWKRLGT